MFTKTVSNTVLLNQVKSGNRLAFNEIYNKFWDELYYYSFNFLKSEQIAQDIVQNIFFDLWEKRESKEIKNLPSYLFQSVRYQCLKELNKMSNLQAYESHFSEMPISNITSEELDFNELKNRLNECLKGFSPKQRQVFEMSRFENMSNKEIADELELSSRTVEWHIHSVVKKLKQTLVIFCYCLGFII